MTCILCTIAQQKNDLIFENQFFVAIYDRHPINPGHAILFPKQHVVSLLDLEKESWKNLLLSLREVTAHIKRENKQVLYTTLLEKFPGDTGAAYWKKMIDHIGINIIPEAFNYGNNDGEAAGRTIHHLHIHIIPRYTGDLENASGGIRNIFPGMGNY